MEYETVRWNYFDDNYSRAEHGVDSMNELPSKRRRLIPQKIYIKSRLLWKIDGRHDAAMQMEKKIHCFRRHHKTKNFLQAILPP